MFEDEDSVGVADGAQAVGDDNGGAPYGYLLKGALDEGFGFVIDRGGRFIEDENGGFFRMARAMETR